MADYSNVETYFNKNYVNKKNIKELTKKYMIPSAELYFISTFNKSIATCLPEKLTFNGIRSKLIYPFKYDVLFRIYLIRYGYFHLPVPVFVSILTAYYVYDKLTKKQKTDVEDIIQKYSGKSSSKEYVVPEEKLMPYIKLIEDRLSSDKK